MAVALAAGVADGKVAVGRDRLLREARVAGLGKVDTPTLEAVDRRRTQLWTIAGFSVIGVSGLLSLSRISEVHGWAASSRLQGLLLSLSGGILVYVADRERRLR